MNSATRRVSERSWDTSLDIVEGKRGVDRPLDGCDRPITDRKARVHENMFSSSSRAATDMRGRRIYSSKYIEDNPRLTRGANGRRKSVHCLEAKYTLQEHMHEQERR